MTGRLTGRSAFGALRQHGRRASQGLVTVTFLADETRPGARVGLAVGKVVGNAVERNRVKRRLRAIASEIESAGGLAPGDYLLSARPGSAKSEYEELKAMVDQALTEVVKVRR